MSKLPKVKQPMPEEVVTRLLSFIDSRFYAGHRVTFAKDQARLLEWVVYWPARWLERKAVTLPNARYAALLEGILQDALRHGNFAAINYLPGYLKSVIQRHFEHHGEAIYAEGKNVRAVAETIMLRIGPQPKERDAVAELANAHKLAQAARKSRLKPQGLVARQKELF